MYVKLIQPKMLRRPMDTDLKARMAPPLGLLTIVSILKDKHKVVLENENIEKINFDDKPDLVGISVTVDVLNRAIEISRKLREKGIPVVAGGIQITSAPDFVPEDAFDSLCIGDAEGTWPEIIKDAQTQSLKKIYRCKENFSADEIVSPAYDFVKKSKYLYTNIVHTSRGCPFRCDFCYNSSKNHKYINRNIDDVLADIKKIDLRHIMFIDDNFIGNPAWTRKFLEELKPLKIKWNAAVSINVANDGELLDLMKEAGCKSLFIGFESINPSSISNVHKVQNNIKNYENAISEIHKRGIMIHGSFVFGLDGDSTETFKTTLDWIVKNKIETVTSHILTPYPGTKVYEELKKADRITSTDFSKYNTAHVVYKPKNMSAEELYEGYLWIYRNVYSLKNILKRLPDCKEQRAAYLTFNLFYRKYGKFTDFLCKIISYKLVGKIAQLAGKYL